MIAVTSVPWLLPKHRAAASRADSPSITLALCGDVMTGRGIDQILPHPSDPRIFESYVKDAVRYVELAEAKNGPIPRAVEPDYIWGDALADLERRNPDGRIVNLETAVTTSNDFWPAKGINYRMHPDNIACLTAAGLDGCALSNNHILDWGYPGMNETLRTLDRVGLEHAGAGRNREEAAKPALLALPGQRRAILFSFGSADSGIPSAWAAGDHKPGVSLFGSLSEGTVSELTAAIARVKKSGDLVVVSIHWGGNWGYAVPQRQQWFAHQLIDEAGVDVVHGHSSHHPKGIEVHHGRPILYGCGDFLNDYEGIRGYEEFRSDLVLLYFITMKSLTGSLVQLRMVPFRIRRFRLQRASPEDATWLQQTMDRVCQPLGPRVVVAEDNSLELRWRAGDKRERADG